MEKNIKTPQNLSYESDGKMGKANNNVKADEKDQREFFNTTQDSE
ncbi:hypothetical protein V7161_23175 [Neobacillus drentensis]|nr:hypothetical protein [Neobacillus bataviensis]